MINYSARRTMLKAAAGLLAVPMVLPSKSWAQADGWLLGQTLALTGPLADLGKAMNMGGKVYFDALNARGGLKGRPVRLITLDDGYDVKRSQDNVSKLLAEPGTLGLFNMMGTPMVEAAMPMLRSTGTMLFAPFTGAASATPKDVRNILPIRASYPNEAVQLVQHLSTIGIKRIALVTQANSFGDEVLAGAIAAMAKQSLTPLIQSKVKNDASDAAAAADQTAGAAPDAVIIGLAGKPALEFIKAIRTRRKGASLYGLSILGASGTIKAMGADGEGVTLSQVVPLPTREAIPVVREFRAAMAAAKTDVEPSHLALEGYFNAKAFAAIAGRVSGALSGKAIIEAAWATRQLDLGGFEVNFNQPGSAASRFIELTMISRNGFVR
jgi:branched-chain amino acid transport system substrate-binding protein